MLLTNQEALRKNVEALRWVEMNVPKVLFENSDTKELIEKWLTQEPYEYRNPYIIAKKFGYLLQLAGIDSKETCTLLHSTKTTFTQQYQGHLENANEDIKIELIDSSNEDFAEFIINCHNKHKVYEYYPERNGKELIFQLKNYLSTNSNNGNTYSRKFSNNRCHIALCNSEYYLFLNITSPQTKEPIFYLKDEEDLETYLLNLSFPVEIEEVYKRISESHLTSDDSYPHIGIQITKEGDTTDLLSIENGEWKQFTKTKNGKTIAIDPDEEYIYHDEFKQYQQGILSFQFEETQLPEEFIIQPKQVIQEIEKEVQKVKSIAYNTFQNKS